MSDDPLVTASKLVQAFDRLGISYVIGGSMASIVYGEFRATQDIDFVADIRQDQVDGLVTVLGDEFYIDDEMIRDAIRRKASFNVIHLATMFKADVFVPDRSEFTRQQSERRRLQTLPFGEGELNVYVASPEDTILHKLQWYDAGGRISDRQWTDVLGVMKVQAERLDLPYLRRWAAELRLTELLDAALSDSGLDQ